MGQNRKFEFNQVWQRVVTRMSCAGHPSCTASLGWFVALARSKAVNASERMMFWLFCQRIMTIRIRRVTNNNHALGVRCLQTLRCIISCLLLRINRRVGGETLSLPLHTQNTWNAKRQRLFQMHENIPVAGQTIMHRFCFEVGARQLNFEQQWDEFNIDAQPHEELPHYKI